MKKLIGAILLSLGLLALAYIPNSTIAAGESGTVTAAARCSVANGAAFHSVALTAIDLGTGVFIEPDGSATGPFSAVLMGNSLLGQERKITIDGKALQGAIAPNGRAYFSGVATMDLGNGTPPIAGVPFSVTATADSLSLSIESIALPTMHVTAGTLSVE
jgi:hypothetical protein